MKLSTRSSLLATGVVAMALVAAACSGGASPDTATPAGPTSTPTAEPLPEGVQLIVAASEIVVGPNRLLLAIHDGEGRPVSDASAHLRFFFLDGPDQSVVQAEADTLFLGEGIATARSLYSARATFDMPGSWGVEASISRAGQGPVISRTSFPVQARNFAPKIGDPAPASRNRTSPEVPIEQLTSQRPTGDADFYKLTIAEALQQPKPLMVIFSTPAFCQTATCGPQLEAAQVLKQRYGDRMNFTHIEIFERPDLLLANDDAGREVNPIVREWNLQNEPWVFIIDGEGRVFDRFEGFAPEAELERSILDVLQA